MMMKVIVFLAIVALAFADPEEGGEKKMDGQKFKGRMESRTKEQKCEYLDVMIAASKCMKEKECDWRNVTLGQCKEEPTEAQSETGSKGKGKKHRNHCKQCPGDSFASETKSNQKAVICIAEALKSVDASGNFNRPKYEEAIGKILTKKVAEDVRKGVFDRLEESKNVPMAATGEYEEFYAIMFYMNPEILFACEHCTRNGEPMESS